MMSEFVCMEESWDLQAVVRSGCGTNYEEFADIMNSPPSLFAPLSFDDQVEFLNFQETFETPTDFDGLDGIYRSFYPVLHQNLNSPQNNISTSTCSISTTSTSVPNEVPKVREKVQKKKPLLAETAPTGTCANSIASEAAKSKGRKNQHKRVVQHVKEDGLSSDMWAWRKYGQKPIKGSPYPRSYYRCSSLKGCLARKQVERSGTDPSIFIITYTAEHSHAHPTRRSSLAGSTRIKPAPSPKLEATSASNEPNMPTLLIKDERSPNFDMVILSPTTPPSTTSIEDELMVQHVSIKNEELLDQGQILEENESKEINVMPDLVFSDDLFPSLEDLDGFLLDQ